MSGFWRSWLDVWCWLVVGFGAILALGAFPATDWPTRAFYDLVYWPLDGRSGFAEDTRFTCGLLGAVTMGWGLTLKPLVGLGHELGARVWRPLTTAIIVWYVIDSAISVALGVPGNAVSNTVLTAGFLTPLLASGALASGSLKTA